MGYTIGAYACSLAELTDYWADMDVEKPQLIWEMNTYMGAFGAMRRQGYDFFGLLGASDADGGVSGTGKPMDILVKDLKHALEVFNNHEPTTMLSSAEFHGPNWRPNKYCCNEDGEHNEFRSRKGIVDVFLQKCIAWAEANGKDTVVVDFG